MRGLSVLPLSRTNGRIGAEPGTFLLPRTVHFLPPPIQWEGRGRPLPGQCHRPLSGPVLRFSSIQARQKTKLRPSRPLRMAIGHSQALSWDFQAWQETKLRPSRPLWPLAKLSAGKLDCWVYIIWKNVYFSSSAQCIH